MSYYWFGSLKTPRPETFREQVVRLAACDAQGKTSQAEKEELRGLLEAHPELKHDADSIAIELKRFDDDAFLDSSLNVLFKKCSATELREFLKTCRRDQKRWEQFQRLRQLLIGMAETAGETKGSPSPEPEISAESLDRIWQKFQENKDKPLPPNGIEPDAAKP